MFFLFFPFAVEPVVSSREPEILALPKTLPMLPVSRSASRKAAASGSGLLNAAPQAAELARDLLRRTLAALSSSVTVLYSRASALFAHVAATLAFDRAARDAAQLFEAGWPLIGQKPWNGSAFSTRYAPVPIMPSQPVSAANPFAVFAEAMGMWANFWVPAAAIAQRPAYPALPFAFAGNIWGFRFP